MAVIQSLPQELLDHILDNIPGDTRTLKTASTVSKAWRIRSQVRIFTKFTLDFRKMKRIYSETPDSPEAAGPRNLFSIVFSYVRDLDIDARKITSLENHGEYLEILRSFTNLTSLRIAYWSFQEFERRHINHLFGHFDKTVKTLELADCLLDSEVLIFLMSLFLRVDNLSVDPRLPSDLKTYKIQDADRSRSVGFRGNLVFEHMRPLHEEFLAFVDDHCSDVRSIIAHSCESRGALGNLFQRQGHKLTSVGVGLTGKAGPIYLSSCTRIRTLSIYLQGAFKPDDPNWGVLRTVNSSHLEEINIREFSCMVPATARSPAEWKPVDRLLCRCYEGSYRNAASTFRVNLHPVGLELEDERGLLMENVRMFWPKFWEKGSVNLVPDGLRKLEP